MSRPALPHPLGATWDGRGTNFALFSANAEKVELCLFDTDGRARSSASRCRSAPSDVWHGYLPTSLPGQLYGYRVHGPYEPEPASLQSHTSCCSIPTPRSSPGSSSGAMPISAYRVGSTREDLSFDRRDNARGDAEGGRGRRGVHLGRATAGRASPWEDTIIYEAHVKGLTQLREDVPAEWRGTFRGLAAPAMIDHLKRLGVTAIELLPIHAFVDDRHLVEHGRKQLLGLQHARLLRRGAALRA